MPDGPPATSPRRVALTLPSGHATTITIGAGALGYLGAAARLDAPTATRAFLVRDLGVPGTLADKALCALAEAGFTTTVFDLLPTEQTKSLESLGAVLEALAASRHERADPVVALGGGVVGDLAGFAAAVYRRGVPIIQCPTTLLAMVDASVGGKTAVNLAVASPAGAPSLKKNMVGAFHQPRAVLADTDALTSLPLRHLRAGLAECIKHSLIAAHADQPDLRSWTCSNAPRLLARDAAALVELIERNVRVKCAFVTADEREEADDSTSRSARALLNLGHTFGHALETIPSLAAPSHPAESPLLHGEAVALGLLAAARAAAALKRGPASLPAELAQVLLAVGLPTAVLNMPDARSIVALMHDDKKVAHGRLRLVLPLGAGRAGIFSDTPPEVVLDAIESLRA